MNGYKKGAVPPTTAPEVVVVVGILKDLYVSLATQTILYLMMLIRYSIHRQPYELDWIAVV